MDFKSFRLIFKGWGHVFPHVPGTVGEGFKQADLLDPFCTGQRQVLLTLDRLAWPQRHAHKNGNGVDNCDPCRACTCNLNIGAVWQSLRRRRSKLREGPLHESTQQAPPKKKVPSIYVSQ